MTEMAFFTSSLPGARGGECVCVVAGNKRLGIAHFLVWRLSEPVVALFAKARFDGMRRSKMVQALW